MSSPSEYYLATMYQEVASRIKIYSGAGDTLVIDHGSLTGLGDDDHPQYVLKSSTTTLNVKSYGAIGDGVANDTAAIQAAWNATLAVKGTLFFPAGTYNYNGPGLLNTNNNNDFRVMGDGRNLTNITIAAGVYLFDFEYLLGDISISDFSTSGGAGLFRSKGTGNNVHGNRIFERLRLVNYTKAAISHSSNDSPYWTFQNITFYGLDFSTTMGISMSGLTDAISITNCSFLNNRIGIKLDAGGNNAYIEKCDFLRFSGTRSGFPATDVWFVPQPGGGTNSGQGMTIRSCKFGNENLVAGDYRILYADQAAGTLFGDRFPVLTTSVGSISGHTYSALMIADNTPACGPFIYSTTVTISHCNIGPLQIQAPPTYMIQYLDPTVGGYDSNTNIIGPIMGQLGNISSFGPVSNAPGAWGLIDPLVLIPNTVSIDRSAAADASDFTSLLATALSTYTRFVTCGGVTTTDRLGGNTSATFSALDGTGAYSQVVGPVANTLMWVEFDVRSSATGTPLTSLVVRIQNSGTSMIHWKRDIPITSSWVRWRFPVMVRDVSVAQLLMFACPTTTGSVEIGRARVYRSPEAVNADGVIRDLAHRGTKVGFNGATPITKPTITGAKGSNAALASLLTQLAALGLITDSSTA